MSFVAVKSREQQAHAMVFRTHQTLTRQRSQLLITLRGHLHEHGITVAKGNSALISLDAKLEELGGEVPDLIIETARLYYHHLEQLSDTIVTLER